MMRHWKYLPVLITQVFWVSSAWASVDSYRFFHVTIETPWYIFLFLLIGVLSPFALMAFLMWQSLINKSKREDEDSEHSSQK